MGPLPPAPFVVGAPRSGTTLLRLMLDAHPHLAIPPETSFLPQVAALPPGASARDFLQVVTSAESWPDFQLPPKALAAGLESLASFDVSEGLRAFYRLYAARWSKPRWGDKTPMYALHLETPLWFAPSRRIGELARHWARHVRSARAFGARDPRYRELRYEDLVCTPARAMADLCGFLELHYDDAMLCHHERAAQRLAEHQERRHPDGVVWLSRTQRLAQQSSSLQPPDPARIGRFRELLTPAELDEFDRAEGDLLRELGYGS